MAKKLYCCECGEEIEIELTRFDLGGGSYYYFCDRSCRDDFVEYQTDILDLEDDLM